MAGTARRGQVGLGQRHRRGGATRQVRRQLVSVAGLAGRPVRLADGSDVGRVVDVVVRWRAERYPAVTGLVVKVGRRRAFVPVTDVAQLTGTAVTLASPRLDVRDFERRDGEALLITDIVDHQLVDIDGIQVVRAADLYLADIAGRARLVGVDVSLGTLLRRLGPARWRSVPTPERVVDWADIHALPRPGGVLLERSNRELRRLRPADLALLLEDIGQPQREQLLAALELDLAADALEEMDEDQRGEVLAALEPEQAAAIVARMEPDEATEALRDLDDDDRQELLERLPEPMADEVERLLAYAEDCAGGIMTTVLVTAAATERVADVIDRLRAVADHHADVDAVVVLDADGQILDDISLYEIATADRGRAMADLVGPPWPVLLPADAPLPEVLDTLLANRRSSVLVIGDDGRPLGRILADDMLDALNRRNGNESR